MSYQDPNQGQYPPNQGSSPYGGGYNPPPQPTDPYAGQQQPGYGQPGYGQPNYGQQQYGSAPQQGATSLGMAQNTAAGLSYVLGWVTGVIFFFTEKQNRFVRFHAMQSIIFFGGISVLDIILNIASGVGGSTLGLLFSCATGLLGIVTLVGWIVLLVNSFQGKYFKLPVIGDYAEKYANQPNL